MGKIADSSMEDTSNPFGSDDERVTAANALEADDIVNRQGEKLGKLSEVMLNVHNGRIAYAVMSSADFRDAGDGLLVVPWDVLALDPVTRRLVLDLDRQAIERAPRVHQDHWAGMADDAWKDAVHSYFGTRP